MEDAGGKVIYPTARQVCEVNRRMIEEFGGSFVPPNNVRNLDALEYILGSVRFSIFGRIMYASLKEKAAAIAHHIISRHIFHDGNKRTAIHIAWEFLRSNGIRISLEPTIVELSVAIATGDAGQEEVLQWLHSHQQG